MRHFASPDFWDCYKTLPNVIKKLADKNFRLLKDTPYHPSLHFKKIGKYRAVRVGSYYRALAVEVSDLKTKARALEEIGVDIARAPKKLLTQ